MNNQAKKKILFVLGTRPEAIKCAPVILSCKEENDFETHVLTTSQHRELQDDVLHFFGIIPDHDLDLMKDRSDLTRLISEAWLGVSHYLEREHIDLLLVQGDTTTAFIAALAAQYQQIPVAHIEAGLRTHDKRMPFPEEINRRLISQVGDLHFCPTEQAKQNLLAEHIDPATIYVVGNSGIDALLHIIHHADITQLQFSDVELPEDKKLVLVTCHRRENWGKNLLDVCAALEQIAKQDDVHIVFLVHPNPEVSKPVHDTLREHSNITLLSAVSYHEMALYLKRAACVVTDSGGIQEEAPMLGKPVLVLREKTERSEGMDENIATLVGTDPERIVTEVSQVLKNYDETTTDYRKTSPYGDGLAANRIRQGIRHFFDMGIAPEEFIYSPQE